MSSPVGDQSPTVYLEDIDPTYGSKKPADSDGTEKSPHSSQSKVNASQEKPNGSNKRQRTLEDMFFGGKKGKESVKKAKLSPSDVKGITTKKITVSPLKTSGLQKLNSIPFSLSAYIESLDEDKRQLLRLECEVMGKSWLKILKDEITEPYFISLKRYLWNVGVKGPDDTLKSCKVYPPAKDIYAWSRTPLGKVKVVIIGQESLKIRIMDRDKLMVQKKFDREENPLIPFTPGLCFSVPVGARIPPSLVNIYAELRAEYPEFEPPKHGNLTAWASNGVLLLNTCLTVHAHEAGSHSNKGWEQFTDKVVDVVDRYGGANLSNGSSENSDNNGIGRGVVFLAWGSWAMKRVAKLNKTKHLILTSAHPSPFSAHRGFLGNGHFKAANEWLETKYGPDAQVDWCNLTPVP